LVSALSKSRKGAGGAYYGERLSAQRLRRCYEIAPPRVRRYLDAEIEHAGRRLHPTSRVLELGCGYGRVMAAVAGRCAAIVGIDTSATSLEMARDYLRGVDGCHVARMNAIALGFRDGAFDVVICLQNGISAFHVDPMKLMREAVRVTRSGGCVLMSSYSEEFWIHRLEWFRMQAERGLIGEIDWARTGDGVIVCTDGFEATTVGSDRFRALCDKAGVTGHMEEVDGSSVFCEIRV
jgi:2-polyprenyl-6-hydroxyphenyl methylase/3-demethylubiquinone-9 3-methyltransferase